MIRLYIDESGHGDLRVATDPNQRFLGLTGVALDLDHHRQFLEPEFRRLKRETFGPEGEAVCFHRKDIVQRRRPFEALRDPAVADRFDQQLLSIIDAAQFTQFSVVMDKLEHFRRYQVWRFDPYHYCLHVMLERYVSWLTERGERGDVLIEARSKAPDKKLKQSYERAFSGGTPYVDAKTIQGRLTSNSIKFAGKTANIAGLQLADMLAQPTTRLAIQVRAGGPPLPPFSQKLMDISVPKKMRRVNGRVRGYGAKWLP